MKTRTRRDLLTLILVGIFFGTSLDLYAQVILSEEDDPKPLSFLDTSIVEPSQDSTRAAQLAPFEFLNSLVEEVLRLNPSIHSARRRWAASTKKPSQVASLPNPEVSFSSMSSGNLLPYSTIGNGPLSWASFMFMQKIPWPGKLNLKRDIAETEAAQNAQR